MRISAASASVILHALAMALLFWIGYSLPPVLENLEPPRIVIPLEAPRVKLHDTPGGGGGDSPLPARKGRAPEPAIRKVFIPPTIQQQENPRLALPVAMLEVPAENLNLPQIGDPFSRINAGLSGRNGILGIGDRPGGTGIGPGENGRGFSAGSRPNLRLTRGPEPIFKPEPEYSEEARKARFQGVVVLSVEIGPDGRTSNIRVVRGAGLGLDQKAIEAVAQWRFRPAIAGEKPVAVTATVEVGFHLL